MEQTFTRREKRQIVFSKNKSDYAKPDPEKNARRLRRIALEAKRMQRQQERDDPLLGV